MVTTVFNPKICMSVDRGVESRVKLWMLPLDLGLYEKLAPIIQRSGPIRTSRDVDRVYALHLTIIRSYKYRT